MGAEAGKNFQTDTLTTCYGYYFTGSQDANSLAMGLRAQHRPECSVKCINH